MKSIEKIPTFALPYLVNGDPTNLTDEEQQEIDGIVRKHHIELIAPITDSDEGSPEPYFSSVPFFGLPTEVEDCIVIFQD